VRDIDDPTLPDWVRNPVEFFSGIVLRPSDVAALAEMGFTVRQARNLLRLANGDLSRAVGLTAYLETEADNALIERLFLAGSGASPLERENIGSRFILDKMQNRGRVCVTPAEIAQFLTGADAGLGQRVRAKFPKLRGPEAEELIAAVEFLRDAIADPPPDFINPFALMGLSGDVGQQIFGEGLSFAAGLDTQACKWLLQTWRDGVDFEAVCESLDAAASNIETARQLLLG
jgi:hypothetical protein